jgi:hypothetical protein
VVNKKLSGIDKSVLFYLWNVYLPDHDVSWLSGRWKIYALCHKPLKKQKNELLHLKEKLNVSRLSSKNFLWVAFLMFSMKFISAFCTENFDKRKKRKIIFDPTLATSDSGGSSHSGWYSCK